MKGFEYPMSKKFRQYGYNEIGWKISFKFGGVSH